MNDLHTALANANMTFDELISIARPITQSITYEIDKLIEELSLNIENATLEDLRLGILQLSLKSFSLSEARETSALKATCSEMLKDEKYASIFQSSEGTVAAKQSLATAGSASEAVVQAIFENVYTTLKLKLDECHRIVDALKSVLSSRMQEMKFAASANEGLGV